MSIGSNYNIAFLEQMLGISSPLQTFSVSSLSSEATRAKLKAAGIDVNSNQYKAVVSSMMSGPTGGMGYTNIQAIKNRMSHYDKDGDYICPTTGLAGLVVTEANCESRKRIIPIPESSREEMFQLTKREFIRENGVANGDATRRSEVYTRLYRQTVKKDRLAAGYTMQQYERMYTRALVDAVRAENPHWQPGQSFDASLLNGITRESVENMAGNSFRRRV